MSSLTVHFRDLCSERQFAKVNALGIQPMQGRARGKRSAGGVQ